MSDWTIESASAFAAELVRAHHDVLIAVHREQAQREGRGVVTVLWPCQPDRPAVEEVQIAHWALGAYREANASATGGERDIADSILARLDNYNPDDEMVVSVAVGPQCLTCSFTVTLQPGDPR